MMSIKITNCKPEYESSFLYLYILSISPDDNVYYNQRCALGFDKRFIKDTDYK